MFYLKHKLVNVDFIYQLFTTDFAGRQVIAIRFPGYRAMLCYTLIFQTVVCRTKKSIVSVISVSEEKFRQDKS